MPLLGDRRPNVRMIVFASKLDLARWHVVNGAKEFVAFLRHDDDFGRRVDDPTHDVALDGRWLGEHGVKCGHDRHFEAGQQLEDVAPGFTTENPVLMLKANDVESCIVQELGRLNIVADHVVANLEAHCLRIVIGATPVRHGNDASLQIRASCCDRPMKIMSKGSDSAATRKMIADERHTLKPFHSVISKLLSVETALARLREVAACTSHGRLASGEPDCVRRRSRCGTGPIPV